MAGSSGWYFVRAAYEQGMIDRRRLAGDLVDALKFRLWGSTDAGTAKVRARMGTYLTGVRERDLRRMAPRVLAGVLPRLYPQMLAVAYEHQDAGRPIYICTAASQEMARLLSLVLSFDGGIGSRAEVLDGVYTGREGGLFTYREGKAQAIRELAAREGLRSRRSATRTPTRSPTCRCCARSAIPVAVNPDSTLARVAREEGWEVLHFDRLHRRLKVDRGGDRGRGRRRRGPRGGAGARRRSPCRRTRAAPPRRRAAVNPAQRRVPRR